MRFITSLPRLGPGLRRGAELGNMPFTAECRPAATFRQVISQRRPVTCNSLRLGRGDGVARKQAFRRSIPATRGALTLPHRVHNKVPSQVMGASTPNPFQTHGEQPALSYTGRPR
jgi:hypothetical protein